MTDNEIIETMARAMLPGRWEVMDAAEAETRRKYKGKNVGWPNDQFKDTTSMITAKNVLSALRAKGMDVLPAKINVKISQLRLELDDMTRQRDIALEWVDQP